MRKRVLVCAYSCVSESGVKNIGGEAELGWNIVKQLSRFFDVYVLTHEHNKTSIESLLKSDQLNNVYFFYLRLPKIFNFLENFHKGGIQIYSYLWQIKAYFVAKKLHKKNNFTLFHHITYANDWMASYIGALLPVPYLRGPGGGAHRVPKTFVKNYLLRDRLSQSIRSIGQWVFRHDPFFIIGHNRAKTLLVCNNESFNALPKKWQKKASFFPVNGVAIENTLPVGQGDGFSVLSAGKLIKIKGFDLAIQSFKIFALNNPGAKLIIVGDGPELNNLKKIAQSSGVSDNVFFKGWMSHENLMDEMRMTDVFLFCSLRDGGGAVVVEAMAAEKPVVCFDIAGPGLHIDETCGIKIMPGNPEQAVSDTAKALERLYKNKDLRMKLGDGGRNKVEREYTWDILGERLQKIYQRALNRND